MSGLMDFAMLAVMIGGGAFVWINKDEILAGLNFGPNNNNTGTTPDCTANPDDPGCADTGDTSGNSSDCKDIYNGSCNTECSGGGGTKCDACKDACGGGGGGGSSGGGSDCKQWCRDVNCSKYEKNCSAGCSACKGGGGSSGGDGGGSNSCSSVKDCPTCSGSSSRKCTSGKCGCSAGGGCVVSKCPSCGSLPNYRICKNNNTECGCAKTGGSSGGGSSSGGCKSVQDCPKCNIGGTCRHCSSGKCGCWDKCSGFAESRFEDLVFPMSMGYNFAGR